MEKYARFHGLKDISIYITSGGSIINFSSIAHLSRQCLKEHLMEQDIVGATLFLASKTNRMMTG